MKEFLFFISVLLLAPSYLEAQRKGDTVSAEVLRSFFFNADPARDTPVCYSLNSAVIRPTYPGGHKELIRYVNYHIEFPQSMADSMGSKEVVYRTIIDRNGKIILQEYSDYKNEIIFAKISKVLKTLPLFVPGETRRGKSDFKVFIKFYFTKDRNALNVEDPYYIPVFPTDNPEYRNLLD